MITDSQKIADFIFRKVMGSETHLDVNMTKEEILNASGLQNDLRGERAFNRYRENQRNLREKLMTKFLGKEDFVSFAKIRMTEKEIYDHLQIYWNGYGYFGLIADQKTGRYHLPSLETEDILFIKNLKTNITRGEKVIKKLTFEKELLPEITKNKVETMSGMLGVPLPELQQRLETKKQELLDKFLNIFKKEGE